MTVQRQRNSLRRSSISINVIRNSVSGLSKGLSNIGKRTSEILKITRDSNLFKKTLNRKDDNFFRKRRENVARKQREDELEAASVTGVAKTKGSLIQKSTRGFFGRILNFLGVLLLGWALENLPKFINAFQKLFKLITKVVGIMSGFIKVITGFLTAIGTGIANFLGIFTKIDFAESAKKIQELIQKGANGLVKLNQEFLSGIAGFLTDEQISGAALEGIESEIGTSASQQEGVEFEGRPIDTEENQENEEIETRDNGGDVVKGEPYLIGLNPMTGKPDERTETFFPDSDGFIASNKDTTDLIQGQGTNVNDEQLSQTISKEDAIKESDKFVNDSLEGGIETLLGSNKNPQKSNEELLPKNEFENSINDANKFFNKSGKNKIQAKIDEEVTPTKKEIPNLKRNNKKNKNQVIIVEKIVSTQSSSTPVVNSSTSSIPSTKKSDVSTFLQFQSVSNLKYT